MLRETDSVAIKAPVHGRFGEILTGEARRFLAALQREFGRDREELLRRRAVRWAELKAGKLPDFLPETKSIREGDWRVAPAGDLQRRRVEITGPCERKMMINALNSGADVFMADFEDAFSPTWDNLIQGQLNLIDAIERRVEYASPDGKRYRLNDQVAQLFVRPRGWHLFEKHALYAGQPMSASLFDFGLYFFHNARRLLGKGAAPYFYLPKLESHREARLWNDVFVFAQESLGIPRGTIKATVLIETVLAAFEMHEILYELRDHSAGLNAGRWDYIFSVIKKLGARPEFLLPDRGQVAMTVPFMCAYSDLLVKTCHRRGAFAIGGMAAFIPNRKKPDVTVAALAKVQEDKLRESGAGFDGTWVAHPDLVPVAMDIFERALDGKPNQLEHQREDVHVVAADLLDVRVPGGEITDLGLRQNVNVGVQYLASWLRGVGAAAIFDLMEDTATAEISRSQIWQWVHAGAKLEAGPVVTGDLVRQIEREELAKIRTEVGDEAYERGRFDEAAGVFEQAALSDDFVEFLTFPAYEHIDL